MVADAGRSVERLELLGEDERQRVLYDWNATSAVVWAAAWLP